MGSAKKTISYRYDAVGNRVGMTDPDGGRFTYAWDAVNRISHLVNPQGDRTTYAYDPGGRRTVKKLANGTRASFSYDDASNLRRLANLKSDGTTISSFDYTYDKTGNRTAVLEADGSRVTWSYDDTYQLTGEHRTGSHPYRNTFAYDSAGNRTLKDENGARTTYSYDSANQLETAVDGSGMTTYTFDADGNQELVEEPNGDRTTNTWDYENRTTLVELPSGIRNTMAYEPGGLRVKLDESTGTKKFVWDEQNYLAETDGNDDTQVVYTNEPRRYGNLISQRRGTDSHWYHFDAIGSTRGLTDSLQAITDARLYDAWGRAVALTGTTTYAFSFVGRSGYYLCGSTPLYYVRSRFYAPAHGRWLSVDPFALTHLYPYSNNNAVNTSDPAGLAPQPQPRRFGVWNTTIHEGPVFLTDGVVSFCFVWAAGARFWQMEAIGVLAQVWQMNSNNRTELGPETGCQYEASESQLCDIANVEPELYRGEAVITWPDLQSLTPGTSLGRPCFFTTTTRIILGTNPDLDLLREKSSAPCEPEDIPQLTQPANRVEFSYTYWYINTDACAACCRHNLFQVGDPACLLCRLWPPGTIRECLETPWGTWCDENGAPSEECARRR